MTPIPSLFMELENVVRNGERPAEQSISRFGKEKEE